MAVIPLVALSCGTDEPSDTGTPTSAVDGNTDRGGASTTSAPDAAADWLCHPDLEDDPCTTADLETTRVDWELQAEGENPLPAEDAVADCFYAHPAAMDEAQALVWTLAEVARLRTLCRIFVPAYEPGDYEAVLAAFDQYLAEDGGDRPFVLIGHAEGSDLLTRLTQERIDADPTLQARLLSAMLIGGAAIQIPEGGVQGGTFQQLPICTDRDQTACIITFRTYEAYGDPTPDTADAAPFAGIAPGMRAACTHPAGLDGSRGQFREASFPTTPAFNPGPTPPGLPPATTPYVSLPEYFVGSCHADDNIPGASYLQIEPSIDPDDQRRPGPLTDPALGTSPGNTQNLDIVVTLGDLAFLIERQLGTFSG